MNERSLNQSLAFIKKMEQVVEEREETIKECNDFESYLYEVNHRFASDAVLANVTTDEEFGRAKGLVNESLLWLLNKTHKMPLTARIVKNKRAEVKRVFDDIFLKADELPKRDPAFRTLRKRIEECKRELEEVWPTKRPWMTEKLKNKSRMALEHAEKYYNIYREQQGNKSDVDVPEVLAHDVEMQTYYLDLVWNYTLRKSANPPTPKPAKTRSPYVRDYANVEEMERDMKRDL
jgi:hypothetical protein